MTDIVTKALSARRESKHIDFKASLDLSAPGAWPEIVKDIVAFSNSGGGVIVIGMDNSGNATGFDVSAILACDPATITDQVYKYTGVQFSDIDIAEATMQDKKVALMLISEAPSPLVFTKPGTYQIDDRTQKNAFSKGSVYFRHGAKSEPGYSDDLRAVIERQVESIRKSWLKGVRKVVEAPTVRRVLSVKSSAEVRETQFADSVPIRITDDPKAPAYKKIDTNISHPYRQMDVIQIIRSILPKGKRFNQWDILCIKKLYKVEENKDLFHKGIFSSIPQYSDKFIKWLTEEFERDQDFFRKCRRRIRMSR